MLRLRFATLSMTRKQLASTCHAERSEASHTSHASIPHLDT